ncbi:hypothetical protein FHS16_005071 [Paenibacillus endophyticus]|uniref:Uncharacterized protein n=1 Tax=Paenibacillus endophyticus TaxID=1294268 RepID=A0A7W5CCA9_9BACL|nr:hypothetical protein [Paenibacillus endophyticus]MBB3154972.1 hypothetical protein [Paenibacillus endophyticus]
MIVVTAISAVHLPKAIVMAKSVKEQMPGSKIVVALMEDKLPSAAKQCSYFDETVLMKDIAAWDSVSKFFFQYTLIEAERACRSFAVRYVYDKYGSENHFVSMDAGTMMLSPLNELPTIWEAHPIAMASKVVFPESLDAHMQSNVRQKGIFDTAFVALRRHSITNDFLKWWCRLSENNCYYEIDSSRFADQSWLDFTHTLFDNVYAIRNPGYLVNADNLMERWNITAAGPNHYEIEGQPLRIILPSSGFLQATAWIEDANAMLYQELYENYRARIEAESDAAVESVPWCYSIFASGEAISDLTKSLFRRYYYENPETENPYLLTNAYFGTGEELMNGYSSTDEAMLDPSPDESFEKTNALKRRKLVRKKRKSIRRKRIQRRK